jgi:hypothetical protein
MTSGSRRKAGAGQGLDGFRCGFEQPAFLTAQHYSERFDHRHDDDIGTDAGGCVIQLSRAVTACGGTSISDKDSLAAVAILAAARL